MANYYQRYLNLLFVILEVKLVNPYRPRSSDPRVTLRSAKAGRRSVTSNGAGDRSPGNGKPLLTEIGFKLEGLDGLHFHIFIFYCFFGTLFCAYIYFKDIYKNLLTHFAGMTNSPENYIKFY